MIALLAKIFLLISFLGLGIIIFTKILVLVKLPDSYCGENKFKKFFNIIKNSFSNSDISKNLSLEKLLQKILSKTRVFVLRIENKISSKLSELRIKSQEKKKTEESYWEKIKNTTKKN